MTEDTSRMNVGEGLAGLGSQLQMQQRYVPFVSQESFSNEREDGTFAAGDTLVRGRTRIILDSVRDRTIGQWRACVQYRGIFSLAWPAQTSDMWNVFPRLLVDDGWVHTKTPRVARIPSVDTKA